ncbi:MAG: hypothetical protein EZS28_002120 [Streblomastix strix]|uniref:MSP domain-containing protein n=1 Tax=Streblomastix strix TaxID=222440 RepID=A0A5J4X4Z3_9EUKA|nr:MAG: hypothetical protein EZS28_002120 [Streblomastix strix]
MQQSGLFGVPLEIIFEREGALPTFIWNSFDFLESIPAYEGMYRTAPSQQELLKFIEAVNLHPIMPIQPNISPLVVKGMLNIGEVQQLIEKERQSRIKLENDKKQKLYYEIQSKNHEQENELFEFVNPPS